jgi:hypothetical protein
MIWNDTHKRSAAEQPKKSGREDLQEKGQEVKSQALSLFTVVLCEKDGFDEYAVKCSNCECKSVKPSRKSGWQMARII